MEHIHRSNKRPGRRQPSSVPNTRFSPTAAHAKRFSIIITDHRKRLSPGRDCPWAAEHYYATGTRNKRFFNETVTLRGLERIRVGPTPRGGRTNRISGHTRAGLKNPRADRGHPMVCTVVTVSSRFFWERSSLCRVRT